MMPRSTGWSKAQTSVAKGHQVNALDDVKANPVIWAAWVGTLEMVQYLVSAGGNIENSDSYGDTPLKASMENPDINVRNYLEKILKTEYNPMKQAAIFIFPKSPPRGNHAKI